MHRTQLILEDWQYQALKSVADRRRMSISSLVREILAAHLGPKPSEAARLGRVEGIAAGDSSRARGHDAYLYGREPAKRRR